LGQFAQHKNSAVKDSSVTVKRVPSDSKKCSGKGVVAGKHKRRAELNTLNLG